ncbi:stage V sporulation protein AE [Selenomonadales bacterium OttesenSCG-928-I06]|nr:stage V sporulation protein AE [Selenomonadales bacterium OttesenSCG-928-I06]
MVTSYITAFVVGGLICVIGQLLLNLTKLTSAHILVLFVVSGAILSGLGIYKPLAEFAGAGATVPLLGFGHGLVVGTIEAIDKIGFLGIFSGGLTAASIGVSVAVISALIISLIFNPKG